MNKKIITATIRFRSITLLLALMLSVGGQPARAASPAGPPSAVPPGQAPSPPRLQHPQALEAPIRRALGRMLNTSSQGLRETRRKGAISVDLQQRFQIAPVATVDAQGRVQITDYAHLPPAPPAPAPP